MTTALDIGEVDVTDYILDKSMSCSVNKFQVTLVGYPGDIELTDGITLYDWLIDLGVNWTGAVTGITKVAYSGPDAKRYYTITGGNEDPLSDYGAGSDLSDASPPASWNKLSITDTEKDGTNERRAIVETNDGSWRPGHTVELTATEHDVTAETATVMDVTVTWPTKNSPLYTLDLGWGDFATAMTGAAGGGPLTRPTLKSEVAIVADAQIDARFAVPTFSFGAASAGVATTIVRSDATIDLSNTGADVAANLYLYATQR